MHRLHPRACLSCAAQLRTIEIEGEPWFHATDVCKCVGLTIHSGVTQHLGRIEDDEKQVVSRKSLDLIEGVDLFLGKAGTANAVSEAGLYRLIMRADGAASKPFRDWVVKEPGNTCFTVL